MLYHMRDVKDGTVRACEVVGCGHGEGVVLDWHVETAKGDHFCAVGEVEVI